MNSLCRAEEDKKAEITTSEASYQNKRFGISFNPLAFVLSTLDMRIHFPINDQLAVTMPILAQYLINGHVSTFDKSIGYTITSLQAGVGAHINLSDRMGKDSWFLRPDITAGFSRLSGENYLSMSPGMMFGYTWAWENGFNLSLGLGGRFAFLLGTEGPQAKRAHLFNERAILGATRNWFDIHRLAILTFARINSQVWFQT